MSLGLWCAGVELGGGGWRRGEGQVETCHDDGLGAVKNEREAWIEGPRGRVTSRGGWHLGHRRAQVYMEVIVLTKSIRRTCESSEAQKDLAGRPVEDSGDTCRAAGMRMEYGVRYSWRVSRVWASKPGRRFWGADGTWQYRGVSVEAKPPHEGCGGRRI